MKWILGTRGSKLALAQSEQVKNVLEEAYEDLCIEIKIITTTGDKRQDIALDQFRDKGIFVKEIEEQLLSGSIDLAVHSMKDMPSQIEDRLCFTNTLLREDARDALILRNASSLQDLPMGAIISTGSIRRSTQLLKMRSDLNIQGIRGNVETRIRKMEEEKLDGIILAAAGLHRLHLQHYITSYFSEEEMIPACGQGALAIEIRKDREDIMERINKLSEDHVHQEVEIERALLSAIDAGCHTPFGVRVHIEKECVHVNAMYQSNQHPLIQVTRTYDKQTIHEQLQALVDELKKGVSS